MLHNSGWGGQKICNGLIRNEEDSNEWGGLSRYRAKTGSCQYTWHEQFLKTKLKSDSARSRRTNSRAVMGGGFGGLHQLRNPITRSTNPDAGAQDCGLNYKGIPGQPNCGAKGNSKQNWLKRKGCRAWVFRGGHWANKERGGGPENWYTGGCTEIQLQGSLALGTQRDAKGQQKGKSTGSNGGLRRKGLNTWQKGVFRIVRIANMRRKWLAGTRLCKAHNENITLGKTLHRPWDAKLWDASM